MKLSAAGSSPTVPDDSDKVAHDAWRAQRRYLRRTVARVNELADEARAVPLEDWTPPFVIRTTPPWRWTVTRERSACAT